MEIIEEFKGTVILLKEISEHNCINDNTHNDLFLFGMMATDEKGNRFDPSKLRRRASDGKYVIVE